MAAAPSGMTPCAEPADGRAFAVVGSPKPAGACLLLCLAACLPEFDPDLGSGSGASSELDGCGSQGRACCVAPLEPCQRDLLCSPETQRCTRRPVLSCDDDSDCAPGDVCCETGLIGTCEAVAKEACPTLDLAVDTPALDADPIETRFIDPELDADRCLIERGCVGGAGVRRLLRVTTTVNNVGDADLLLGSPDETTAPTTTTCSGEPRFAAFLRYELVDSTGPQAQTDVPASCDAPTTSPLALPFDCDFQGLWRGFSQIYAPGEAGVGPGDGCPWLDITGLLPGDYTLRVTVNPDGVLPERNRGNNTPVELPVTIPAFDSPSAPCPEPPNPLLGSYAERECGWARASFQAETRVTACTPTEDVLLTCTGNDPELLCGDFRACDGPDICSYEASSSASDGSCYFYGEANASLICPATGQYSLWVPSDASDGFSCKPYFFELEPPTLVPDAGAPAEP